MKLHFYHYDSIRQMITTRAADVQETEKTYKALSGAGRLPFIYESEFPKTELNKGHHLIFGLICVLDHADPDEAQAIFREYATRKMNAAQEEMSRWANCSRDIENAGFI